MAPNDIRQDQPAGFARWPSDAQDRFNERTSLLREQNNIPNEAKTPLQFIRQAQQEAFALCGWPYHGISEEMSLL